MTFIKAIPANGLCPVAVVLAVAVLLVVVAAPVLVVAIAPPL